MAKTKTDENQIWLTAMIALPVVLLMDAGEEITDDAGMQMMYAGVFGGLGGLLGFTANYFTKDKSRTVKILAVISLIIISVLILYFLSL